MKEFGIENLGGLIINANELLLQTYIETRPKIIKRKLRFLGKYRNRKVIIYNPFHDFLGLQLQMNNLCIRHFIKRVK